MKTFKCLAIIILLLMSIGCSGESTIDKPSYTFTANLVSVVSHDIDKYVLDGIPIVNTIQVSGFNPSDIEFHNYNSQFVKSGEYKHVRLSKNTTIKNHNGVLIKSNELELDHKITFTVELSSDGYNLLAKEICVDCEFFQEDKPDILNMIGLEINDEQFGGLYIEDGLYHVNIVGSIDDYQDKVKLDNVKLHSVNYSLKHLNEVAKVLSDNMLELGISIITTDEKDNKVYIYIKDLDDSKINSIKKVIDSPVIEAIEKFQNIILVN